MSDERPPISDERLDELLGGARWPDVDHAVVNRLAAKLRGARHTSPWSDRAVPLALAASVTIAFILGTLHFIARRDVRSVRSVAHVASVEVLSTVPSRAPTVSEQTIAIAMSRKRARTVAAMPRPSVRAPQFGSGNHAGTAGAVDIVAKFDKPLVRDRFAAARAVGSTCDDRVVRELIAICEERDAPRAAYRREALAALLACHDRTAARYLKSLDTEPFRRAELQALKSEIERNL